MNKLKFHSIPILTFKKKLKRYLHRWPSGVVFLHFDPFDLPKIILNGNQIIFLISINLYEKIDDILEFYLGTVLDK